MTSPHRTALIGFGKMGTGYADDPVMSRYFPYATHAQVLADHPSFAWEAVVDPSDEALAKAREKWRIPCALKNVEELGRRYQPEVAVIATPPDSRIEIIELLPSLRAVMVEKPVGMTAAEAVEFLDLCDRRGVAVQVNLWRRGDEGFRRLAAGEMAGYVGVPQAVFGVYGNGLINNGTHMVDFVRMMFGEVETVRALGDAMSLQDGPIPGDVGLPFCLDMGSGLMVNMQPIAFEHYRENSLDVWGQRARLSIMNEGLEVSVYPRCENRAVQGEWEIRHGEPMALDSTVGGALYRMYDNLAAALDEGVALWSPGGSALQTARVIQAILQSAQRQGSPVAVS